MLEGRYQGGLLLMEQGMDEHAVQRELQQLDPRLFLDRQFDTSRRVYFYVVMYHVAGDKPPQLILDWREPDDTPKPLSSGVALEIRRMMSQGTMEEKLAAMKRRQEELDQAKADRIMDDAASIAKEWERYDQHRSGVLPRSQKLRQSRDRLRRQGRKV